MLQLLAILLCLAALILLGAVLLKLCIRWIAKEDAPYKSVLVSFLFTACVLILLATMVNLGMQGIGRLFRSQQLFEIVDVTKNVLKPLLLVAGLTFFTADKAHIPVGKSFLCVLLFVPLFVPTLVFVVAMTSKSFRLSPYDLIPPFMV